jgi:hypothetical protein
VTDTDEAGEAAAPRFPKRFFNDFLSDFSKSFIGMASMRMFGGEE